MDTRAQNEKKKNKGKEPWNIPMCQLHVWLYEFLFFENKKEISLLSIFNVDFTG